jgi:hypothetical protein
MGAGASGSALWEGIPLARSADGHLNGASGQTQINKEPWFAGDACEEGVPRCPRTLMRAFHARWHVSRVSHSYGSGSFGFSLAAPPTIWRASKRCRL